MQNYLEYEEFYYFDTKSVFHYKVFLIITQKGIVFFLYTVLG